MFSKALPPLTHQILFHNLTELSSRMSKSWHGGSGSLRKVSQPQRLAGGCN